MAKLIGSEHFKKYVEGLYIECYGHAGYSRDAAIEAFSKSFYDDYAMLSWILDSIYIATRREGDNYVFVTAPIVHKVISEKNNGKDYYGVKIIKPEFECGRMEFRYENGYEYFEFPEMPDFKHGHINKDGTIGCYGGYDKFRNQVVSTGVAAALMSMYNFACVSRYGTSYGGVEVYK